MKKMLVMVAAVLAAGFLGFAALDAHEGEHGKKEAKVMTLKGEIVDTGCYIAHASIGPDHKSCATRCIAGGMPMGLLTEDKKLYLLTLNHDDADPFNQAKKMAASIVEITGKVQERGGIAAIEVTAIKEVKAAQATKK